MKKKLLTALLASAFVLGVATPSFAQDLGEENKQAESTNVEMYASKGATNNSLARGNTLLRSNIKNALGGFDAKQIADEDKFYSVATHEFSVFKFGDDGNKEFYNREDDVDIKFCEVTWGNYWHEEAVEVYLINPKLKNSGEYKKKDYIISNGNEQISEDDNLYFAGVAFNKMVNTDEKVTQYRNYENEKFEEIKQNWGKKEQKITRTFVNNELSTDGNFQITGFNLPEEVESAEGIVLVDVTKKLNEKFYNKVLPKTNDGFDDDGFDLDAIQVWGKENVPVTGDEEIKKEDSATGYGEEIGANGNWFMQNEIKYEELSGEGKTFKVVAGRNKEEVGSYTVKLTGDNTIEVTYKMNDGVTVKEEHLAISKDRFTSANPGKLDNSDYNKSIDLSEYGIGEGDTFYIFAHFKIAR